MKKLTNKEKLERIKIRHDHPTYLYCCACGTGGAKEDGHEQMAINIHILPVKDKE